MRTFPHKANPCPVCGQPEDGKFRPFCGEVCSNVDLDQVRAELLGDLERLAETLLGEPSLRKPRTWRWRNRGSLCLELRGHKRGTWHSFETSEGGGPFQLIQHAPVLFHGCGNPVGTRLDGQGGEQATGANSRAECASA